MAKIRRAILSVTDKAGVVAFSRTLHELGVELVSTGGTAKLLRENGFPVTEVAELTGFPEMLDGRVKTLHPKVAGGILAVRGNPAHREALEAHGIPAIDMVVVNLYAFEKAAARAGISHEELIENIDIGGPTMIRAAAKNFQDVAVVTSSADYEAITAELQDHDGELSLSTHWELARKAFARTAAYDAAISARISTITVDGTVDGANFVDEPQAVPGMFNVILPRKQELRYGENPHQAAALYALPDAAGVAGAKQLQGKELSFNNLVDLDAAWQLVQEFRERPAAVIIKHTNPCGSGQADSLAESYRMAFACDPVSAFGGVLAFNRDVDEETALEIGKTFVEAVAAPGYSAKARTVLGGKKNLRLLCVVNQDDPFSVKSISGGILVQSADRETFRRESARVATSREPTEAEWTALEFGWKLVKHVKSNAIVFATANQGVAVGAGQMSRVDSVRLAAMKAVLPLAGTVVASDAFFPFPDGVEEAAKHGATAIIQPGGSVKDQEVIDAANRLGLAMVFTGIRHFRH
ncbi:MAG: bifunctional phosphoribosylaminoimidazolecarboxamide formyltransferase/IMP cyclohydrolase [Bryobacterales bacterium]|nr:bifunctional phosphoribosylaminoimidazolecarboxamide formyltransferase/IMP cyclohydrolase [Bryobacterales bacterium]